MSTAARRLACGTLNMAQVNRRMGTVSRPTSFLSILSSIFSNKTAAAALQELDTLLSKAQGTSVTAAIPSSAVFGVLSYYANSLPGLSTGAKQILTSNTSVYAASGSNVNGVLTLDATTWVDMLDSILLLPPRVVFRVAGINNVTYFSSGSVMTVTGGANAGTYNAGSTGVTVPVLYPGGTVNIIFYGASSPVCTQPDGPPFVTTSDPTITTAPTTQAPGTTTQVSEPTTLAPEPTTLAPEPTTTVVPEPTTTVVPEPTTLVPTTAGPTTMGP